MPATPDRTSQRVRDPPRRRSLEYARILESPDVRVGPDPTKFSGADPIGPGRNREIYPIADRRQFAVRIKLAAARRRHIIDFLLGVCTENLNPDVVVMKSAKDRV